jgi:hypothetical protein
MMTRRSVILAAGAAAVLGAGGYMAAQGTDYEKAADEVWTKRAPGDDEELAFLVRHATLAANNHNTQPWLFSRSASGVVIKPDFTRTTPVVDPDNHHLFATLGCAAENLVLAAGAAGKGAEAIFKTRSNEVDIAIGGAGTKPELFDAILQRQCTRSEYDGRPTSPEDLAKMETAAVAAGASMSIVTDKAKVEQVLELIVSASDSQISNPEFVDELKSWIRFNAAAAVSAGDGLFSGCSGNPTLPSWLGNIMFGWFFTAKAEKEKLVKQVRSSAGLAVFASEKNEASNWFLSGRSVQRFALQSTALGLKHAYLNQPVEVPNYRTELAALLGLGNLSPDLLVRFGYADPMPRSLRRPVSSVIVSA